MSLEKNTCKLAAGCNISLIKLFINKNISCFLFSSISVYDEIFDGKLFHNYGTYTSVAVNLFYQMVK